MSENITAERIDKMTISVLHLRKCNFSGIQVVCRLGIKGHFLDLTLKVLSREIRFRLEFLILAQKRKINLF